VKYVHNPDQDGPIYLVPGSAKDDAAADIIFVHGLGGGSIATWHPDGKVADFFPAWIADDKDLPKLRVYSVSYPAAPTAFVGTTMPIEDRAVNLLGSLENNGIGLDRPTIFVTHSLGGLIVKEMLQSAVTKRNAQWEKIAGNTRGVVFLSTPHTGSGMATFFQSLNEIMNRVLQTTVSMEQLERDNPMLRDLNDWYRQNAEAMGIKTVVMYESQPTEGALVVDASSADPGITGVHAIRMDADHLTICKPTSKNADIYLRVRNFIRDRIQDAQVTQPSEPKGEVRAPPSQAPPISANGFRASFDVTLNGTRAPPGSITVSGPNESPLVWGSFILDEVPAPDQAVGVDAEGTYAFVYRMLLLTRPEEVAPAGRNLQITPTEYARPVRLFVTRDPIPVPYTDRDRVPVVRKQTTN
jgi:pimeloyl-ACP methyl ester carboxylesterase